MNNSDNFNFKCIIFKENCYNIIMKSNEYCICYDDINNHHDLFDIIKGKSDIIDIREKCIFRGLDNDTYRLEPSSLRNDGKELNKFISNNEMIPILAHSEKLDDIPIIIEKDVKIPRDLINGIGDYMNIIQKWKEFTVLMKFINASDKNGLKINVDESIRRIIDFDSFKLFFNHWPDERLFGNIALAQHYGTPTRFLDWSYDYRVSMYFATKDIINNKPGCDENDEKTDGVLWAFNHKLFNNLSSLEYDEKFKLQFYRAEYNSNPNLNAQKGLFAFFINNPKDEYKEEFHQIIINQFKKNDEMGDEIEKGTLFERVHPLKTSDIPGDEKIFYKFIIPHDMKQDVLKELIKENCFTNQLFPSYNGVSESIKHKVILDELNNK